LRVPAKRIDPAPAASLPHRSSTGQVSRDWISGYRPGDPAQTNGTCVGRGSANAAEILLMRHNLKALATGEQIDGDKLYLYLRSRYYGDQDLDAGAQIRDGAKALIDSGILPPDSIAESVPIEQEAIAEALKEGPLIQGHMVDSAWQNPGTDGRISNIIGSYLGGHCTVGIGQWYHADREADLIGGNSWGDPWAWHGIFRMGWMRWRKTCVDLWRVRVNPESIRTWTGHRQWVKSA
jgi:hypothetical protein